MHLGDVNPDDGGTTSTVGTAGLETRTSGLEDLRPTLDSSTHKKTSVSLVSWR
jgi:hypothetical protein